MNYSIKVKLMNYSVKVKENCELKRSPSFVMPWKIVDCVLHVAHWEKENAMQ